MYEVLFGGQDSAKGKEMEGGVRGELCAWVLKSIKSRRRCERSGVLDIPRRGVSMESTSFLGCSYKCRDLSSHPEGEGVWPRSRRSASVCLRYTSQTHQWKSTRSCMCTFVVSGRSYVLR